MTLPTIHSNGTGAETLREGYIEAARAVASAREAIQRVEFNARDYYVQGPDAWNKARADRQMMFAKLDVMHIELFRHAEVADDWLREREVRRKDREAV